MTAMGNAGTKSPQGPGQSLRSRSCPKTSMPGVGSDDDTGGNPDSTDNRGCWKAPFFDGQTWGAWRRIGDVIPESAGVKWPDPRSRTQRKMQLTSALPPAVQQWELWFGEPKEHIKSNRLPSFSYNPTDRYCLFVPNAPGDLRSELELL
jgi:hypothetical protein